MTISHARAPLDTPADELMPRRPPLEPLKTESTRDRVVNAIRDAIIQGRLRPGEKVPEEDLAQQLGISRTPIREAIRVLEQQGLVRVQPKKGTYIAKPNRTDEANALTVRAALEELAIKQAIERSTEDQWDVLCEALEQVLAEMAKAIETDDPVRAVELDIEFHAMLVRASNNHYLLQSWHLVGVPFLIWSPERDLYPQSRHDLTIGVTGRHEELMRAIRTKNADACAEAVRHHISRKIAELPV
jgi:DNA-binding GntR family transcriptional regulator